MNDQWSEILEAYHMPGCPTDSDSLCTCRMCEVIEGVAQLEAENKKLRRMMEVNAPDFPVDETLEAIKEVSE